MNILVASMATEYLKYGPCELEMFSSLCMDIYFHFS
jgi:hypothetical protein